MTRFAFSPHPGGPYLDVYDKKGAKLHSHVPVHKAAEVMGVDPHEVAWSQEEHGRGDTAEHTAMPAGRPYKRLIEKRIRP